MDEETALKIFAQLVTAFHEIHSNNVMYKNVHSDHFILQNRGQADRQLKVISFSQLRPMGHDASVTEGDKEAAYVAPEVLAGGNYTKAADVWGLGIILFQLANKGVNPFDAKKDDSDAMKAKIDAGEHKKVAAGFSPKYVTLLDKLLMHVPEERWTISQVVEHLKDEVSAYVKHGDFIEEFKQTRRDWLCIGEELKLLQLRLTDDQIDKELEDYM